MAASWLREWWLFLFFLARFYLSVLSHDLLLAHRWQELYVLSLLVYLGRITGLYVQAVICLQKLCSRLRCCSFVELTLRLNIYFLLLYSWVTTSCFPEVLDSFELTVLTLVSWVNVVLIYLLVLWKRSKPLLICFELVMLCWCFILVARRWACLDVRLIVQVDIWRFFSVVRDVLRDVASADKEVVKIMNQIEWLLTGIFFHILPVVRRFHPSRPPILQFL